MILILAMDGLDLKMVEKFKCKELMQSNFGNTDISDFTMERTVVLWASFLTGKNMENKIPIKGQWKFQLKKDETFFKSFNSFKAIDVPAFSFKQKNHEKERKFLAGFFKEKNSIEDYDEVVWKNHEENKNEFFEEIGKYEILMIYFNLADAIGHLSFGDEEKMKMVYEELNSIVRKTKKVYKETILIISDHGMKSIGRFGDHTKNGFWSLNKKINLKKPKITDFYPLILKLKN